MENFVCRRQKAGEAWDDEDDSCLLSAYCMQLFWGALYTLFYLIPTTII